MGQLLPSDILFDECATLFRRRIVYVTGTDPVSGITAQGRTREEVVSKIAEQLDRYLERADRTGDPMCRNGTTAQRVFAAHLNLLMSVTPLFAEQGAPVLALRSDLPESLNDEERGSQLAEREELHVFMGQLGWRTIKRSIFPEANHAWRINVLVNNDSVRVAITHDGLPWLYQGPLYDPISEDAKTWLSLATEYGYVELLYFIDPGGEFTPDNVDEYEELLDQERALIVSVPISWSIGE